jgi:hypothetical protein
MKKIAMLSFAALSLLSMNAAAQNWAINTDGLYVQQPGKPRVAVQLPDWQWAHEPYACPPAIAVGPRGEAVVTSNVLPVLWKIDPATLAVTVHRLELDADTDKDVGFSGLVYSERNGAYFAVSEAHGTLWRIDPLLRRAQKVNLAGNVRGACAVSIQRQERASVFSRLCLRGRDESRLLHIAADQRSAYVQAASCAAGEFALKGGAR